MKEVCSSLIIFLLWGFPSSKCHAQDDELKIEESSEVFLEEYSDEFQELFFEALKQKGIENYDKEINLLLECKRLDPKNAVIDHELAKAYYENKNYVLAQGSALEALSAEPGNIWFLETLMKIAQDQGSSVEKIISKTSLKSDTLKENMALVYFNQKNYEAALAILKELRASGFKNDLTKRLTDSLTLEKEEIKPISTIQSEINTIDPLANYIAQISQLIEANKVTQLEKVSAEALEKYPSQPYFYYAFGVALNKRNEYREAIEMLESALDYLFEDVALANRIYQELVFAYTALNDTSKANMYLRMIKSGY
jgi:tetratricopeptide (TPR) repeat protein